jgi:hypothetical protein
LPLLEPDGDEELVVQTELVRVTYELLKQLQKTQVVSNTTRGSVLDLEERHGTILEDLSADPSMVLLEFKVQLFPTVLIVAQVVSTISYGAKERKYMSNMRITPLSPETTRGETAILSFGFGVGKMGTNLSRRYCPTF